LAEVGNYLLCAIFGFCKKNHSMGDYTFPLKLLF